MGGPQPVRSLLCVARPGDDLAGSRVNHIAESVDRRNGPNDDASADFNGGRADAALHGAIVAEDLADRRACARPGVTGDWLHAVGGCRSTVAHFRVGAHICAPQRQVK